MSAKIKEGNAVEIIDQYAREQIGKIWAEIRENVAKIMSTLIGVDGNNGLRSDIRKLTERLEQVEEDEDNHRKEIQHYIDVQRKIDCFGLAEFKRRDELAREETKEGNEVKVAVIGAEASRSVGKWQATASLFAAIASLIGVVLMVLFK